MRGNIEYIFVGNLLREMQYDHLHRCEEVVFEINKIKKNIHVERPLNCRQ